MRKLLSCLTIMACTVMTHGCYYARGVQTAHVTDKEVNRTIADLQRHNLPMSLEPYLDSVPAWRNGKQFYVTDNRVKLVMDMTGRHAADTLHLEGKTLTYKGYTTGSVLDNNDNLILQFSDPNGNTYSLPTNKTENQFRSNYALPFMIDMDMVQHFARQLVGKLIYVKTNIWYDNHTAKMIDGRKFVQVRVDSVQPGNMVLPLKVVFTALDNGRQAMQWMNNGTGAMQSRDFDALFAFNDPHDSYPNIKDEAWQNIINGKVGFGMSKEECRLAKGTPKNILRDPDQNGLKELWQYDGGGYLLFEDGILSSFK